MQGQVAYVNEKQWNGKMLYSFKLTNDDALYMCGNKKPFINKGDYIDFTFSQSPKGQSIVDPAQITVKKAEVMTAGKSNFEKANDTRQRTIEWQAARNSAIAAVEVIVKANALKLPAKEAAKMDVVLELISELTRKYFDETHSFDKPKNTLPEVETVAPDANTDGDGDWE